MVNTTDERVRFRYLHMNPNFMDAEGFLNGRQVSEGEIIGKVATWGDYERGTSYHIHFNMQVFTKIGWVWVNPYVTLVAAYERQIGGRGVEILPGQPAPPIPDKPPVILHKAPEPAVTSATPPAKAEEKPKEKTEAKTDDKPPIKIMEKEKAAEKTADSPKPHKRRPHRRHKRKKAED